MLEFEPGVTVVVGPNGSGKSNLVDARGLGARRPGRADAPRRQDGRRHLRRHLRTARRSGRAEVSLTIDNTAGAAPDRVLARSRSRARCSATGDSEYQINGAPCRLLDIQELLSDSGIGRQQHVIVGQGQLDKVLNATPEDRRGFIEEAAGILKYRRRKEKTVRKLEAMQANLARLSDLTGEIRRQLTPLGKAGRSGPARPERPVRGPGRPLAPAGRRPRRAAVRAGAGRRG